MLLCRDCKLIMDILCGIGNLQICVFFVKSDISNDGVCLTSLTDSQVFSSSKWHDEWLRLAGYIIDMDLMKNDGVWIDSEEQKKLIIKSSCKDESDYGEYPELRILDQPILHSNIVEMHLDRVFKDKTTVLCLELFRCVNVRVLSLRHNNLISLPADIGRMSKLRTLILTQNCLSFNTIPFTLTFCQCLKELHLDDNLLDALPGFLLEMPQLETVYRHGNHNYFKSTFMCYHTTQRERVMPLRPTRIVVKPEGGYQPDSLQLHAIRALIGTKVNFFTPGVLPVTLQDYVAKVYYKYKICAYCSTASNNTKPGFRVITFKNPYVGNTCVPFEHWTCSRECGVAVEEPAQREERLQVQKLDKEYEQYIQSVNAQFCLKPKAKCLATCVVM